MAKSNLTIRRLYPLIGFMDEGLKRPPQPKITSGGLKTFYFS
jgi:hypothetical protein